MAYSAGRTAQQTAAGGEALGYGVAAEFSDKGKSGKNMTGLPQFTEMLSRIDSGNQDGVSYVLVFKLSRFGRNVDDVLSSLQLMQDTTRTLSAQTTA